jgi:hypothetical protein
MKYLISALFLSLYCLIAGGQQKVYTLGDWYIKDWDSQNGELNLDVSEYKLNFNHPLPFMDMQSKWCVKAISDHQT